MNRQTLIKEADAFFDTVFFDLLAQRIAARTPAGRQESGQLMRLYFTEQLMPQLEPLGFSFRIMDNPDEPAAPFLTGERMEDPDLPTILLYGHADTVAGMQGQWEGGRSPYELSREADRWFGRGTADNKGQHWVNLAALALVIRRKNRLGFNVKLLFESGEELGSPGLHAFCLREKDRLAADVLIASDGPRIAPRVPTIFGGSRAACTFDLTVDLRPSPRHSGNFGGILAEPGILLSHAIASLVDDQGRLLVPGLRPAKVPAQVAAAIEALSPYGPGLPADEPLWGEPGLSPVQKLFGWNSLSVLAFECGTPASPANAIPGRAWARCQIRYTADSDAKTLVPAIRAHLQNQNLSNVHVQELASGYGGATRMLPTHPWVIRVRESLDKTLDIKKEGKAAFLPNIGGTIPNDAFSHILGLPTIWIPHSFGGCCQHAPNEHLLASLARQGLRLMTGLFWDLGQGAATA